MTAAQSVLGLAPDSYRPPSLPDVIEAIGLGKTYQAKTAAVEALKDVSFLAEPGKVTGLLGVNGAGKTTCLRILSTVLEPTAGTARVNGHDVVQNPAEVRRSIGFLSNSAALYGRLTGRQALRYFGALYGLGAADIDTRIQQLADRLMLHEFLDRPCDKLSTGQKQRVSIARATLHAPPVILFDEPTAGLDIVMAQTVLEFIEECRSQGKTILFSTHIMSEVERLCDDVVIIHGGRRMGVGTPSALKEQHGETSMERTFLKVVDYQKGVA